MGKLAASSLQQVFGSISVAQTVLYGASNDKVKGLTPREWTDEMITFSAVLVAVNCINVNGIHSWKTDLKQPDGGGIIFCRDGKNFDMQGAQYPTVAR